MRIKRFVILSIPLAFLLFVTPKGNFALAESSDENLDSFYAMEFEKLSSNFDAHIQQVDNCISDMETFRNEDADLFFDSEACTKLNEMRPEAQQLYNEARARLEKYIHWISSLTESAFERSIKRSNVSYEMLLTSMQDYLDKNKKALLKSELLMEKQTRRLREMERKIEEAERRLESRQGQ